MAIHKLPKQFVPGFSAKGQQPTVPVVIDRDNPIGKSVVAYYPMNSATVTDVATPREVYKQGSGNGISADVRGLSTTFDGTVNAIIPTDHLGAFFNGRNQITISVWILHDSGASGKDGVAMLGVGTSANADVFGIEIQSSDIITFEMRFASGNLPEVSSSSTLTKGVWHHILMSYDGADMRLYLDGELETTVAQTGSWTSTDAQPLVLGENAVRFWDGKMANFLLLDRGIDAQSVRSLYRDQYQILKPATPQVYFTPTDGVLNIAPAGIASAESFGSHTIATGAVDISPTGIASAESFGSHTVALSQAISVTGIASAESFGSHTITTGAVDITFTGIPSGESIGSHTVAVGAQFLSPTGIVSGESFGAAVLTTGAVDISPTGIPSGEAFGSHTVAFPGAKAIQIDGQDELVINTNLGSTMLYFNGTDYFSL